MYILILHLLRERKFNLDPLSIATIEEQLSSTYGCKRNTIKFILQRLEQCMSTIPETSNFVKTLYQILAFNTLIKLRWAKSYTLLNILVLDFLWNYRGYRHIKGFPVRGQRTWSNGWTASRSNHLLRAIRIHWAYKYYKNVTLRDAKFGFYAEYNNMLWKRQWRSCWFFAKKRRLIIAEIKKQKHQYHNPVINIKGMAAGYIFLPSLKKELTKKQKNLQEQSIYSVGYSAGFSKKVFLESITQRSRSGKFKEKMTDLFKYTSARKLRNLQNKAEQKLRETQFSSSVPEPH